MTPTQLEGEGNKPFQAFCEFCKDDNPSVTRVSERLSKSRQLITRWCTKYRWRERFAAQRARECEQKIAAEERAIERAADITEQERASVARKCFDVANRFINRADEILEEHPVSAVRLLAVGADIASQIGGASQGYSVPAMSVQILNQCVDEFGNPTEPRPEIKTLADAERVIAAYEAKPTEELPCDGWSPDSADATPTLPENEPRFVEPEPVNERTVPSRCGANEIPTHDNAPRSLGHLDLPPPECEEPKPRYGIPLESR